MRDNMKGGIVLTLFAVGLAIAEMRHSGPDGRCRMCEIDAALRTLREPPSDGEKAATPSSSMRVDHGTTPGLHDERAEVR